MRDDDDNDDDNDDDDDDDDDKSLPLVPILSRIKLVRSPHSYFLEIRFIIIIIIIIIICQSTPEASKWSLYLRFPVISLFTLTVSTIRATCPTNLNLFI